MCLRETIRVHRNSFLATFAAQRGNILSCGLLLQDTGMIRIREGSIAHTKKQMEVAVNIPCLAE